MAEILNFQGSTHRIGVGSLSYIFDVSSGNIKEALTELAFGSEGYAVYDSNGKSYLQSFGFDKKEKADKLKQEIKELIKAKGIKKQS